MQLIMKFTTLSMVLIQTASAQNKPALPPAVDLTPKFNELGLPPWNQGPRDTCSNFAITGAANYEWARSAQGKPGPLAVSFLIWGAREACAKDHDQSMFYEAVAGLNGFGLCRQELMAYSLHKPEVPPKPSDEALRNAEPLRNRWNAHWIRLWDVRKRLSDAQMTAIQEALAGGHPVACGLRWPIHREGDGLIKPPPPDGVRDGHSILLVGYQDDASQPGGGVFRFRNSYGPEWHDHGYGLMSYSYVRNYANDALWLELTAPDGEIPIQRFEAEDMTITGHEKCESKAQAMDNENAKLWSNGKHLDCTAELNGFVTMEFDVKSAGTYRVRLLATAAPDYGKVRVVIDGKETPGLFDLRAGRVCPGGSLELGQHKLAAGKHTLRVTGASSSSLWSGWSFGLDALDLLKPLS